MSYTGMRVLVTGGQGFIGSNVAVRLAQLGAHVTVADSAIGGCGSNPRNLAAAPGVEVLNIDIGDLEHFPDVLQRIDMVFNFAGEISHARSMTDPVRDLTLNTIAQLKFLLALEKNRPGIRVVYAGTRQVFGAPQYLPIDEAHPLQPVDFNGIHKLAATNYHQLLTRLGRLDCVTLRLTNIYGPRMALDQPAQGFLGQFLKRALLGEDMVIYGDGKQLRDPLFVDDAADAFLLAGLGKDLPHRTYNVGGSEALQVGEIAAMLAAEGGCRMMLREFPPEQKVIDIGSYYTDSNRFKRVFDWRPKTDFRSGVAKTLEYFRANAEFYLPERIQTAV